MNLWVHYHPQTGQIVGWENASAPYKQEGFDAVEISLSSDDGWAPPDPMIKRVDVVTRMIVDMTPAEKAEAVAPSILEVTGAIAGELSATDSMLVPDRNVPNREAWAAYRQALRDLSKGTPRPTAMQMLAAFPERPDGIDPAATLRARILEV